MSVRPIPELRIDSMRREDLAEVLAIEVTSFALPWTEEMFANELIQGALAEALVARLEEPGRPACVGGYICVWVVSDELHINNLAVHPSWRQRGVASALLQAALDHGRAGGACAAFPEVRASNAAAQRLYRRFRFDVVGVRSRYYTHPIEDALIMKRERL